MKNKLRLSGISFPSSIKFISKNYISIVDTKIGKVRVEKRPKENKVLEFIFNLPLIRGVALLFYVIYINCRLMFIKHIHILIGSIVFYLILTAIFSLFPESVESITLNSFSYIFIIIFIYLIRENHGAEHKLIHAYESDKGLSLHNIKKQSKEHPRCGSTIVAWVIIMSFILRMFGVGKTPFWLMLVLFSISYELSELSRFRYLHLIIYAPSWLLQKLVTKEPSKDKLIKGKNGLIKLLKKEISIYNQE